MIIGYFVSALPPVTQIDESRSATNLYGGTENVAINLASKISNKGYTVKIFTTSSDNNDYTEEIKNLKIYRYRKDFKIGNANISTKLIYAPLKTKIDIIHAHAGNPLHLLQLTFMQKKRENLLLSPTMVMHSGSGSGVG